MQEARFSVGDLVVLKSGSSPMTVSDVVKGSGRYGYRTSWFVGNRHEVGTFPEEMLQPAPQPAAQRGAQDGGMA